MELTSSPSVPLTEPKTTKLVRIRRLDGKVAQGCDVYIGKENKKGGWDLPKSTWANPFTRGSKNCTPEELADYEHWIRSTRMHMLETLRGKRLGCFCDGFDKCHGSVLIKLLEEKPRLHITTFIYPWLTALIAGLKTVEMVPAAGPWKLVRTLDILGLVDSCGITHYFRIVSLTDFPTPEELIRYYGDRVKIIGPGIPTADAEHAAYYERCIMSNIWSTQMEGYQRPNMRALELQRLMSSYPVSHPGQYMLS